MAICPSTVVCEYEFIQEELCICIVYNLQRKKLLNNVEERQNSPQITLSENSLVGQGKIALGAVASMVLKCSEWGEKVMLWIFCDTALCGVCFCYVKQFLKPGH